MPVRVRCRALPTEQPNPASRRVDLKSPSEIVALINREDARVPAAVGRERARITQAVALIVASLRAGGRLLFIGAGTSGRLGVIEAAECPPTFGTPPSLVRGVMAGGKRSMFRAKEGAEDDAADGAAQVSGRVCRGDAVVGIAASGVTPFVRGGLKAAKRKGCVTVLITSNPTPVREADVLIAPRVGPEFIAGSTRLKSATAAKLVLNTLTTASFIRLGKVYDQWMVDVKPSNRKLVRRAIRMVARLGGVPQARAVRLFEDSGRHVKTAVVMARLKTGRLDARRRLARANGALRTVLEGKP